MKQYKVGQTLGIGIGAMLLVGLASSAITAFLIEKGTVTDVVGVTVCWWVMALGTYAVSWYTAKRCEKNKMQISAAVIGVYICVCGLVGNAVFPERDLKLTIWPVLLIVATALGVITSCAKKERKR